MAGASRTPPHATLDPARGPGANWSGEESRAGGGDRIIETAAGSGTFGGVIGAGAGSGAIDVTGLGLERKSGRSPRDSGGDEERAESPRRHEEGVSETVLKENFGSNASPFKRCCYRRCVLGNPHLLLYAT